MPYRDATARRQYHNAYMREYRQRNIEKFRAVEKARRVSGEYNRWRLAHVAEVRAFVNTLKRVPCMDCGGVFPPCVMEFDHRDPTEKHKAVGNMVGQAHSLERVLKEISKCDLVCANCHRIRHHGRDDD